MSRYAGRTHCDHAYVRDDANTKQCIKCKKYKAIDNE